MPSKCRSSAQTPSKPSGAPAAACPDTILAHRLQALIAGMDLSSAQADGTASSAPPQWADTALILQAIEQSKTFMLVRIDHLAEECTLIHNDLDKIRGRLTEAKSCVSATEDANAQHDQLLHSVQQTIRILMAKSDDAENRQHRNNMRVLGLPEGVESERAAEC